MLVVKYLLRIPRQERKVEENRKPVTVDQEKYGEKSVDGGFGDDVGVEAVAEVDGVDVVTFQIAVHDGEEDLKKEVDGVYQHGQQIEPCFSRHHEKGCLFGKRFSYGIKRDAIAICVENMYLVVQLARVVA